MPMGRRLCCCGSGGTCQICVTVKDCAGVAVSGATVTVSDSGVTIGTCTTDATGKCCVAVSGAGTYHIEATKSGYSIWSDNQTVACPGTANLNATITTDGTKQVKFEVCGCYDATLGHCDPTVGTCSFPVQGATISINGGTYTTNASGLALLTLPSGTYPFTVTAPHSTTITGNATVTLCSAFSTRYCLTPDTNSWCCQSCPSPMPKTIYFTDANGTWTLTYQAAIGGWTGCGTKSGVPLATVTPPSTVCNPCSTTTGTTIYQIEIDCTGTGSGFDVTITWFYADSATCPGSWGYTADSSLTTCSTFNGFCTFGGAKTGQIFHQAITSPTCYPLSLSGSLASTNHNPAAGSFTVTE